MQNKNQKIETEQSLIGGLLLDSKAYDKILAYKLDAEDFISLDHIAIFAAIKDFEDKKEPWDITIISAAIAGKVNFDYLIELVKNTPGTSNINIYASMIKEASILRKLVKSLGDAAKRASDPAERDSSDIMDACITSINELKASGLARQISPSLDDSYDDFLKNLLRKRKLSSLYNGICTLPQVDDLTGGLQDGHLIVIAARPSVGKSALGLFMTLKALQQGMCTLFWSTEMDNNAILARLVSQTSENIPLTNLTHCPKRLSDGDLTRVQDFRDRFDMLYVESGYSHVKNVLERARILHKQGKLDMLVVDYLQNLKGDGDNMVEKLGDISSSLKMLAMELSIPVVALAQLNRQAQHLEVPTMAEIKGSGSIEQDADLIILLHQNSNEPPEKHWLICAKNRHGETKNIPIIFDKPFQNFKEDKSPDRILSKPKKTFKDDL